MYNTQVRDLIFIWSSCAKGKTNCILDMSCKFEYNGNTVAIHTSYVTADILAKAFGFDDEILFLLSKGSLMLNLSST